jgi:hypothetical protein
MNRGVRSPENRPDPDAGSGEDESHRRPQIPLFAKALLHGAPFVVAAAVLPTAGLVLFGVLAGIIYLVTSRKCPRCGKRTFEGLGLVLLGPLARCSHCGARLTRRRADRDEDERQRG